MQKDALVSTIAALPGDVDAEEVIEKVLFLMNLEIAVQQADAGKLLTESELKARLGKWLS
jgi:hypothetical protein